MADTQPPLFGRTSPEPSVATKGGTSPPYSLPWWEAILGLPPTAAGQVLVLPLAPSDLPSGASSTVNTSESPNDAAESSLSTILEENAPARYYLSPTACQGILKRAAKRGRGIPTALEAALRSQAAVDPTPPTHKPDG